MATVENIVFALLTVIAPVVQGTSFYYIFKSWRLIDRFTLENFVGMNSIIVAIEIPFSVLIILATLAGDMSNPFNLGRYVAGLAWVVLAPIGLAFFMLRFFKVNYQILTEKHG